MITLVELAVFGVADISVLLRLEGEASLPLSHRSHGNTTPSISIVRDLGIGGLLNASRFISPPMDELVSLLSPSSDEISVSSTFEIKSSIILSASSVKRLDISLLSLLLCKIKYEHCFKSQPDNLSVLYSLGKTAIGLIPSTDNSTQQLIPAACKTDKCTFLALDGFCIALFFELGSKSLTTSGSSLPCCFSNSFLANKACLRFSDCQIPKKRKKHHDCNVKQMLESNRICYQ